MAGLFGDQRQQEQFQIPGGEDPWATATALFAGGASFEAVAAVAMFAVGGMMVSHFLLLLVSFRYNLRYIFASLQGAPTSGFLEKAAAVPSTVSRKQLFFWRKTDH